MPEIPHTVKADRLLVEARKYLKAPFYYRGRSVLGLDCLGLVIMSFRKCGVPLPSDDGYSYNAAWWRNEEDRLHEYLRKHDFEEVTDPQRGDVVTFKLFGERFPAHHCGILVSPDQVIHVSGVGEDWESRCRTMPISPAWLKRVAGYFRYKGMVQ